MPTMHLYLAICCAFLVGVDSYPYSSDRRNVYMSPSQRRELAKKAKDMFYHGYDSYMKYAFPYDELNPIDCNGRGPDHHHPDNINVNDVLGGYVLTLVDSLDTLVVVGNTTEFKRAAGLILDELSFQFTNTTVQVFEATIRVLGSMLSTHLLIEDPSQPFGDLRPDNYVKDDFLNLSIDLAEKLLNAFEESPNDIPYPRVNLETGEVVHRYGNVTCLAGSGSLVLEFATLSRLTCNPVYESASTRAVVELFSLRDKDTGLLGNGINVNTKSWVGDISGVGAGMDSYYEYLLKAFILLGFPEFGAMFKALMSSSESEMRRGRPHCNQGYGHNPVYVNVNRRNGSEIYNTWTDSLQASLPALQVLAGKVEEAICSHNYAYSIWKKFHGLPERYNWHTGAADIEFYPLRPELAESTYMLYRATKSPFYLIVGRDILNDLDHRAKTRCGYATMGSVVGGELEDRMESFFLAETVKYLYLLFDEGNYFNANFYKYVLTTEGHFIPLSVRRNDCSPRGGYPNFSTLSRPAFSDLTNSVLEKFDTRDDLCEKSVHEFAVPLKDKYSYF